jgi:RimJ/RimL family protein N-acetyltransferase
MLERNGPIYTMGNFVVAPLTNIDLIATAYLRLKQEGVLEMIYYECDPGLPKVLATMTDPATITLGCFVKDGERVDMVGLGHAAAALTLPNGQKKAELSEVFFKDWQRRNVTLPMAQMMIQWLFDRSDLDFLYGTTPEKNPAAVRFMKALGFGHTREPIPNFTCWQGKPCGCYVSWMDAERWKTVTFFPIP